ncbi:serine/threonine-protein kinase [Acaryochloris sp. IP29b_bin.148]|uniref:serine/threonine protein kinase n=1 Tax=Acaryochloris sp. IP29b_bin.148 TaxID=2969218 RepID=UPI002611B9B4|nr:serine/threonine-protein kinase [Acaryochloris sp. IP29b_bin.148]
MKLLNKYFKFNQSSKQKHQSGIQVGQLLIDRYELVELVGSGAMGSVYRAKDRLLGDVTVAVKFLTHTLQNEAIASRFAREARIGALLGHQSLNIVRVLDYGLHEEQIPFYVMEFMQGQTLDDLIEAGQIPLTRFIHLITQVCAGLQCAHQGIQIEGELHQVIHRDIKPSNIFLIKDASLGELAKLLDFGIADFLSSQAQEMRSHSFIGTVAYGSPEQFSGAMVDARSDIYSLGITMFEALTGYFPIMAETNTIESWAEAHQHLSPQRLREVDPTLNIPSALEDLIMSCLAKDPEQRPQSATEIIKSLKSDVQANTNSPVGSNAGSIDLTNITPQQHAQRANLTMAEQTQVVFWSIEDLAWRASWPKNKPIANIVFAQTISSPDQEAVGLWVMLNKQEIEERSLSSRHSHFLCTFTPHPTILWITTLFDHQKGPRWLPCYIDLKDAGGQHITKLLSERGYYLLMLFDSSNPSQPVNVVTIKIPQRQCQLLQNCLSTAKQTTATGTLVDSKKLLKQKYQAVKQKILAKL